MIYLDNAATTFPKPECVYDAMDKMNRYSAVNAGRGSYKTAQEASKLISDTKQQIRSLINANINAAVVFTPSITIAINQIINGLPLHEGAVVYESPYEHNAVARTLNRLKGIKNIVIKELPINAENLEIDLEKMKYEFSKEKPAAVFCTHVSNVTGYILPVAEIFEEVKKYNGITVLDTAQSLGLVEVNSEAINADLIAFAGHKALYGPFGIGGFVNVTGVPLDVFITGGTGSDSLNLDMPAGAESKYEASSQNIVAIAGLNAALKVLNREKAFETETRLTSYLFAKLDEIKNVRVISYSGQRQTGVISFIHSELNSEEVGTILSEDFDIAVRTGFHCAPLIHKHIKDEKKLGTVRVGIGQFNTEEEIDQLIQALKEL